MPSTGQPSTRDVEATVRAVEILDALADGGELGTTDVARRTGISAEHRLAPARHAHARRARRARRRDRPLPARRADAALRERGARPAQPPRPRPPPPRGARAPGRRDRDALDPGRRRRDHRRLRADRPLPPGRDAARPPERRPRVVGRQGDARLRRRAAPARQARRVHAADDHRPGRPRGGDRPRPGAGLRRGDRGARGRASAPSPAPVWDAGRDLAAIVALQGPTSRFDATAIARRRAAPPHLRAADLASRSAGTSERIDGIIPSAAIASRRGRFGLDTTPPASVDTRGHDPVPRPDVDQADDPDRTRSTKRRRAWQPISTALSQRRAART